LGAAEQFSHQRQQAIGDKISAGQRQWSAEPHVARGGDLMEYDAQPAKGGDEARDDRWAEGGNSRHVVAFQPRLGVSAAAVNVPAVHVRIVPAPQEVAEKRAPHGENKPHSKTY